MLAAIDFDDETPLEADEIKNEVLKGHLATELEVCEAVIAQQLPHTRFSIGWPPDAFFLRSRGCAWRSVDDAAFAARTPHPALRATFSHKGRRK
jgi:hypothetical protein